MEGSTNTPLRFLLAVLVALIWGALCVAQNEPLNGMNTRNDPDTGRFAATTFPTAGAIEIPGSALGGGRQMDSLATDSISKGRRGFKTTGRVEAGGTYGPLPFNLPSSSPTTAFLKGQVNITAWSIPLGIVFDLGTDAPMRGQRNSIRFNFDAPKALETEQWQQTHVLHDARKRLDSLEERRAQTHRELLGQRVRLSALGTALDTIQDGVQFSNTPPMPAVELDGIDPDGRGLAMDPDSVEHKALCTDSIEAVIGATQARLSALDSALLIQRAVVQRQQALTQATQGKEGLLSQFSKSIRRLELGTCTPTSSEFLINGVTFQGLSFEYAHKELFLSVDRGRSFDDSWRNADPVALDLRRLQQSLFLRDAQDLNPRKLTAVRLGIGAPDGTHVHVGYLYGKRTDHPMGLTSAGGDDAQLQNHVLELDAGHAFNQNHSLQLVYARSLILNGLNTGEAGSGQPTAFGDLLSGSTTRDEAVKAVWKSDIPKSGTTLEAETRYVSPHFQSFGVGFIRNASRAAELRLAQRIGKRLRLRSRAVQEERQLPSSNVTGTMHMSRGTIGLQWNPNRALNIRGGYSPALIRTEANAAAPQVQVNQTWNLGTGWRKRWRRTTLSLDADATLFTWRAPLTAEQQAVNQVMTVSVDNGQRWAIRATRSDMLRWDVDSVPSISNTSLHLNYRITRGLLFVGGVQWPSALRAGWDVSMQQALGKEAFVLLRSSRWSRTDTYLSTTDGLDLSDAYTWTLSFQYLW